MAAEKYAVLASKVWLITMDAPRVRSARPIKPEIDVSLKRVMTSFARAGKEFLIACGITTFFIVCILESPKLLAASFSPILTELIPPLNSSAMYAEELRAKDIIATAIRLSRLTKITLNIIKSWIVEGVPRIIDTNKENILSSIFMSMAPKLPKFSPISRLAALVKAIIIPRIKEIIRAQIVTIRVVFRPSNK